MDLRTDPGMVAQFLAWLSPDEGHWGHDEGHPAPNASLTPVEQDTSSFALSAACSFS